MSKAGGNEKSILRGVDLGPIIYEWAIMVVWEKYREPDGAPIARIVKKLGEMGKVIYLGLELVVRNPEGVAGLVREEKKGP